MNKLKFYVLCCRNLIALKRHEKTVPKEDLCIVINTLDSVFQEHAISYCQEAGIEYHVTASDGTAATGKNCFLDVFEASDNDYAVLIDGDDFITPHGTWTYKQLANTDSPPDVLSLEYQYGLYRAWGYNPVHRVQTIEDWNTYNPDRIPGWGTRCFYHPKQWWEAGLKGDLVEVLEVDVDGFSQELYDVHKSWITHCYNYINKWETHCRIVWFSKAAANGYRFDKSFVVGEDTVLYFEYKHAHMQGQLVMKHLFDRYPTYVYDTRISGVVEQEKDKNGEDRGWLAWLKVLNNKYNEMEAAGMMYTEKVPELKVHTYTPPGETFNPADYDIVWPEGYKPDVLGLVNYPGKEIIKL